jgi:iron complex outermembrane receptor protein
VKTTTKIMLLSSATSAFALMTSGTAFAQSAPADAVDCNASPNDPSCSIVVTGSILRRTDTETPSPVTTVTVETLDQRGISTVQDGLQQLAANNGPALTNSFSANGAFAAGASAISLRGLSTNSSLVIFDGLRAAYYPLATSFAMAPLRLTVPMRSPAWSTSSPNARSRASAAGSRAAFPSVATRASTA